MIAEPELEMKSLEPFWKNEALYCLDLNLIEAFYILNKL